MKTQDYKFIPRTNAKTVMIPGFLEGNLFPRTILAFFLSIGAMTGDAFGSFLKRRFNIPSGAATPLLDQWDFVFGALGFAWVLSLFYGVMLPDSWQVLFILVFTAFLHVLFNAIAFKLKFKEVPW